MIGAARRPGRPTSPLERSQGEPDAGAAAAGGGLRNDRYFSI